MKTLGKRVCQVCGAVLSDNGDLCPVCALHSALKPKSDSLSDSSSELRFEHYTVLQNADGTPLELGRGAMGVTYKAFDVHLRCPVALKVINARFIGDDLARQRFVREARAAASVRHPNVASVFHLGESAGNYFYVMEFVDGETLEKHIRRSGTLENDVALEVVAQVAAGLTAIQKQRLVHRDIKPSNIMVSWEEGRLENVKIIDLGLAKGVAEDTISTVGSFAGTPAYASPEQFAGLGTDIRSDLYSLGITLWEMLSGNPPFQGSAAELLGQHQHAAPPSDKLKGVPAPILALLEVLLAKGPGERFQSPAQLRKALPRIREAVASGSPLNADALRSASNKATGQSPKRKPKEHALRWLLPSALGLAAILIAWLLFTGHLGSLFNQPGTAAVPAEKSIAVLPFESLSENKSDSYFADGVQDEILANVARISQLKVISRTSVMQYRPEAKRDLRQIANALGVANILEGTVRRAGAHVRITVELVDAGTDRTIWSETYDRELTDIFAIQSDVAQTVANKLTATLSPEEKKRIEAKPTDNLEAYELYLRAKELIASAMVSYTFASTENSLRDAISYLEQAVRLDPNFAFAYCLCAYGHDVLYRSFDRTSGRRTLADLAISRALGLQPNLPEVHLAYANHLYVGYRNYAQARVQLATAKRGLPNNVDAILLEASMDRRQGNWEKAVQELNEAVTLDPRNALPIQVFAETLTATRQFRAAKSVYDRLIELLPDQRPMLSVEKARITYLATGDDAALRSAIASLPSSIADDTGVVFRRVDFALNRHDWLQARELLEKIKGTEDEDDLVGCYYILLTRLQTDQPSRATPSLAEHREHLNQKVQTSPEDTNLLSRLAMVDAWLHNKEAAVSEANRAVEMLPISKDAVDGPEMVKSLAIVYTWTDELNLAFETLASLTKTPNGIYYGELKLDPRWVPLRKDPRYEKLLAELAPRD